MELVIWYTPLLLVCGRLKTGNTLIGVENVAGDVLCELGEESAVPTPAASCGLMFSFGIAALSFVSVLKILETFPSLPPLLLLHQNSWILLLEKPIDLEIPKMRNMDANSRRWAALWCVPKAYIDGKWTGQDGITKILSRNGRIFADKKGLPCWYQKIRSQKSKLHKIPLKKSLNWSSLTLLHNVKRARASRWFV